MLRWAAALWVGEKAQVMGSGSGQQAMVMAMVMTMLAQVTPPVTVKAPQLGLVMVMVTLEQWRTPPHKSGTGYRAGSHC
jgi:hypothetical protein